MNIIGWLAHLIVLAWSWPLIRLWWHGDASQGLWGGYPWGRKRWAVLASFVLPIVAWCWLVPATFKHRREREDGERIRRLNESIATRDRDIAFWREQVAIGDFVSAWVGVELLAMWNVPAVEPEPEREPPRSESTHREPQAVPGAHEYSHGCDCRNCVRARCDYANPHGLTFG